MTWLKLGIPILLGVAAGTINWVAMSSGTKPVELVRLKEGLATGLPFGEDAVEKVTFQGDLGSLAQTAIPWAERSVLFGRPAQRDYKKGDLLLWRDATPPRPELNLKEGEEALPVSLEGVSMPPQLIQVDDLVSFVVTRPDRRSAAELARDKGAPRPAELQRLGPFRVVTLGDIRARPAGDDAGGFGALRAAQQRALTIAIKWDGEEIADKQVAELLRARIDERNGQKRILELTLSPRRGPARK